MRLLLLVPVLVACAPAACGAEPQQKPPVEVLVKVSGDPGAPLEGASVLFSGKSIATTDAKGAAKLTLTGNEGDLYDVTVKCPAGFQSPSKPISITLHRFAEPSKTTEYEVSCPPTKRNIVVAVRADNGPNLNVLHLGRAIGRTDASGAATVLLEGLDADSQFELTLDTTEKGNEDLKPQNPTNVFTVKRADDVFTFDVKFTIEKKKVVWHAPPKKTGPIALPTKVNQF
ncbi:MAG: hypothetical protein HYV09_29165 [Deltaproteobacteria bacterium]|nr:hypothetical protein [Deltaproteobacteria bacterium]